MFYLLLLCEWLAYVMALRVLLAFVTVLYVRFAFVDVCAFEFLLLRACSSFVIVGVFVGRYFIVCVCYVLLLCVCVWLSLLRVWFACAVVCVWRLSLCASDCCCPVRSTFVLLCVF